MASTLWRWFPQSGALGCERPHAVRGGWRARGAPAAEVHRPAAWKQMPKPGGTLLSPRLELDGARKQRGCLGRGRTEQFLADARVLSAWLAELNQR